MPHLEVRPVQASQVPLWVLEGLLFFNFYLDCVNSVLLLVCVIYYWRWFWTLYQYLVIIAFCGTLWACLCVLMCWGTTVLARVTLRILGRGGGRIRVD